MTATSQSREKGIKKYCESNHIYFIIVITITLRNVWLGTPMGGWEPPMGCWEPKSSLAFWVTRLRIYAVTHLRGYAVTRLRGYAVTRLRICYCRINCTHHFIVLSLGFFILSVFSLTWIFSRSSLIFAQSVCLDYEKTAARTTTNSLKTKIETFFHKFKNIFEKNTQKHCVT